MIRTWTDEDLQTAVASNITIIGTLRSLGLSTSPGNYKSIKGHIARLGLSVAHHKGKSHGTSRSPASKPLEAWLRKGSVINSSKLRQRLIRAGLLVNQCVDCGLGPIWHDKPITLQLDHINGDPFDNRLENLRVLCPNCHSQTSNWKGRNVKSRYQRPRTTCSMCGVGITPKSTHCLSCAGKIRESKRAWPAPEALATAVLESSYQEVAEQLGCTDNAIRKYLRRKLGSAPKRPRGPGRRQRKAQ